MRGGGIAKHYYATSCACPDMFERNYIVTKENNKIRSNKSGRCRHKDWGYPYDGIGNKFNFVFNSSNKNPLGVATSRAGVKVLVLIVRRGRGHYPSSTG